MLLDIKMPRHEYKDGLEATYINVRNRPGYGFNHVNAICGETALVVWVVLRSSRNRQLEAEGGRLIGRVEPQRIEGLKVSTTSLVGKARRF